MRRFVQFKERNVQDMYGYVHTDTVQAMHRHVQSCIINPPFKQGIGNVKAPFTQFVGNVQTIYKHRLVPSTAT